MSFIYCLYIILQMLPRGPGGHLRSLLAQKVTEEIAFKNLWSVTHPGVQQACRVWNPGPLCSHLSLHNRCLQAFPREEPRSEMPSFCSLRQELLCNLADSANRAFTLQRLHRRNRPNYNEKSELRGSCLTRMKRHFTIDQNGSAHDPERLSTLRSPGFGARALLEGAGRGSQQPLVQICLVPPSSLLSCINSCLECNIL